MSDAELLKSEMDVINPNEKIDSQEIEEFLQSDENLWRLGEALKWATSSELLWEFENVLKGLCEKILSQVDISDNQQKIVEYFLDKFWDKYPDLKEKVSLNKVIDECIQTNDILPHNIALLNERNQLFWSEFQDKKNKIKSIIDNKISGISEAVNKIIAANRTPWKSPYTESQVKYIQLWANVNYGENLQIDGKRWQLWASGLRNGENQRITNLYIYRQELITREWVIKWREALKAFPQLTNIPNLNELLWELSNEQQNRVLQNFLEFFLPFKQEWLHFENLIWWWAFETLMIYLILAEKTKWSNVFLAPLTDSDIPSNITNDSDYYLFKAENLKNIIVDENEINLKNNEQFALLLKQRELNRKVGVLNNIIKQINSLDKTKNRDERINLYKQAINLAKDIGDQGCIDQILIQMWQDFTEAEIKKLFSENELKDLKKARTEAEARWKDSEETHDLLSQIDAQNDKKWKWMVQGVTYAEFKQNWPIEANAFDHQLQWPVYNYSGHIWSSKPEIHPAFKKVAVPWCQPIFIRFKNADENKIIQLFNKANRWEINLVIRNYRKQFANNIWNRWWSYNSDTRWFYAERDMNILSLNDLSYSKTNKDGSVSIYKIWEDTPFKTISKEEQENTRRSSAMWVGSILTREMQINGEEFSSLKNGMDGIQNIISKMKDYKLTDFDTDEARRRAVELRNYTKKLRWKKDSIISLRTHLENVKKARNNESLTTDEEQALNNCITQLVVLERAIKEWWDIDKFVDYILNKKNVYSNDETWEQILAFLRDNAIQIITAIWCAVALVAAIPTWWMSLLWMAAIMTAGSMVWSRLWTELNNLVQNTIFKTTIKVWDEEIEIRFDDPSDVRMLWNWKLSLQDFLINAWTEFVTWTVTCFWFMKAWQLIGKSISWYLSKNPNTKAEAFLKRINPKFAETKDPFANQMFENAESKINQNFWRSWANKFRTEFWEELWEETVETWADEIANRFDIPLLWLLVSTWNSLTPWPNNSKLYSNHKVTLNDFYQDWNSNFVMKLDYDLDSPWALDALTSHFEQHWFIKNPDWTFSKPSEIDPNHSEIIQLIPSKASIDIRNLWATMSSFWIMIDYSKDWEAYYGNVDELNAFKSLVENGGKWIVTIDDNWVATFKNSKTTLVIRPQNDYFWKEAKLAVNMDTEAARLNSQKMDNYLSQVRDNWENLWEILNQLRNEINDEYHRRTDSADNLYLTDEQLLSVLDAHEHDWVLWELTIWQLRQKVKTLSETITDSNIRRFLLEAGFCGRQEEIHKTINDWTNNYEITYRWNYWKMKIENSDGTMTNIGFMLRFGESKYLEIYIEEWKISDYKVIEQLCELSKEMWAWWKIWFEIRQIYWLSDAIWWKEIIEKLINSENFSIESLQIIQKIRPYEAMLSLGINLPKRFFSQNLLTNLINEKDFFGAREITNYKWNEQSKIYFQEMVWNYLEWIDINSIDSELLSDLIIDYHFNKISYNVFLDIKELFRFQIEKWNFLSKDKIKIYKDILNIDKLTNEEKIELHKSLMWKNITEMFDTDIQEAREISKKEISDCILNSETIKQYKDETLSQKYWVEVYNFDWQPFYALAKKWKSDRINPEYAVTRSYSLVWTECTEVWWEPWNNTFLYEGLTPQQIIHISNDDSASGPGVNYWVKTNRVFRLWSPSELLSNTREYNELLILEKWTGNTSENASLNDIKPIAIYCYEITEETVKKAKEYWVGIALINTNQYNKKNSKNKWHNSILEDYMYPYSISADYYYAKDNRRSILCSFENMNRINDFIEWEDGDYNVDWHESSLDSEGLDMLVDKVRLPANQFEVPKKDGKCEYTLKDTHEPPENDIPLEQAKECFFHWLDITAELMDWQQQRSVLSSWSLFLNNPDFMKLWWDIDVATDAQTFRNVALIKWDNWKTKLDQYESDWKIMDLEFTLINHEKLTLKENSNGDCVAEWSDKEWNKHSALVEELIAKWDIRVEFNIPSKDGLLINCEFFPEPKWYWLIQLWTERTEWKVKTYMLNGREVKTVNEELAAMSYMINLAHEFSNNSVEWVQEWKKLKDSVRINNFIQYLSSIWLNTPGDIIAFIDKTVTDYESQVWEQFTIVDDDNNSKTINMSQYLRKWLDWLSDLREALVKIESNYKTVVALESDSWWDSTTITFNEFMSQTYKIKENWIKYVKWEDWWISVDEALVAIEELKSKIDIKDPKNFAYYYEIYQLQTNFIKTWFKKPDKTNTTTQEA